MELPLEPLPRSAVRWHATTRSICLGLRRWLATPYAPPYAGAADQPQAPPSGGGRHSAQPDFAAASVLAGGGSSEVSQRAMVGVATESTGTLDQLLLDRPPHPAPHHLGRNLVVT